MNNVPAEAPVCKDCAHVLGRRTYTEDAQSWKCAHPSNILAKERDVVSGGLVIQYIQATCYAARSTPNACGPAGQWFEPYERPPQQRPSNTPKSADELLGELDI